MAQSKSNIGPLGRTQVYSKSHGTFEWCRASRLTAELMAGSGRGPDRHTFFELWCWLEEHLKTGLPRASKDIEEELGAEGYRHDTIARVKKALGVRSFREGDTWYWQMPDLSIIPSPHTAPDTSDTSDPSVKSTTYVKGRQEAEESEVYEVYEESEVSAVVPEDSERTSIDPDPQAPREPIEQHQELTYHQPDGAAHPPPEDPEGHESLAVSLGDGHHAGAPIGEGPNELTGVESIDTDTPALGAEDETAPRGHGWGVSG
jgi:hypothetical protein